MSNLPAGGANSYTFLTTHDLQHHSTVTPESFAPLHLQPTALCRFPDFWRGFIQPDLAVVCALLLAGDQKVTPIMSEML